MTGRYQARFGYETMTGSVERQIRDDTGVSTKETLLPRYLKQGGYATAVIGKWHLGYNEKYRPNNRGVDHFFGFLAGGHSYFVWDTPETGSGGGAILRNSEKAEGEGYITEAFAKEAASFIRRNKEGPFLLYLSPFNVHRPLEVPEKYIPKSGDVMAGMIKALDDAFGVVLETLKAENLADDTLVVYINDNGALGRNPPYRGGKGKLYEGGVRVPFAMRWPGRIPAGRKYGRPVIQLDILPTVLAAAGIEPPPNRTFDGVDLLPFVNGERKNAPHPRLFWRYPNFGYAIREGDLKLVGRRQQRPQLFDLSRDPGERVDLAAQRTEDVERLASVYGKWERRTVPRTSDWRGRRKRK